MYPKDLLLRNLPRTCLEESGIVVTPGNGFGDAGEGYARVSVTFDTDRIVQAAERIKELSF